MVSDPTSGLNPPHRQGDCMMYQEHPSFSIPVKSTDFGGSLPIFLPSYRQPTDLPQSTD